MLRSLASLVLVSALLATGGCGGPTEYALVGSPRAAGTDGTVSIDKDEYGNYELNVEVEHLPPPDRLGDGLNTYVVWVIGSGQSAEKVGMLAYDPGDRSGHFRTTTHYRDFTLRITAERGAGVTAPSDVTITSRRIQAN